MKNLALTTLMLSASFAVTACDSANDNTADNATVTEDGATSTAPPNDTATAPAPDAHIVIENGTRFRVDPDGTRIRLGPDGADLEIRDENVDVNVGTDRRPSVDIEL